MSQVNEIKAANDIVEIIGGRIDLKRSGSSYKALCPFHGESSPSFFVNQQMQRYKCFGCNESGDVIEFLEKYEGMSFLEALKFLADRAGIELKEYKKSKTDEKREVWLEILDLARQFYHYLLTEHNKGEPARDYLKDRGVTHESIKLFQLGHALPCWRTLFAYLVNKKGYQPETIEETGLIIKSRTGRYYDRFRNRLVFPLKNHRGQVVGFSGRALDTDDKTPKYINSPETKLYHKSEMLFGYNELYQQIRKEKKLIIVEGEFDVVSSFQAHVSHISAIKGSALTKEQIRLIKRSVNKVILCLDADPAGVKATKRAIDLIKNTDLDLRVIDLSQVETEGKIKDVDDLAREKPKLWREVSQETISPYDFLMNISFRNYNQKTAEGQRQIIDSLANVLSQIPHQVEKDFYVRKLAQKLNVRTDLVAQDINRFGRPNQTQARQKQPQVPNSRVKEQDIRLKLEQYLLFLLFHSEAEDFKRRLNQLNQIDLKTVGVSQIFKEASQIKPFKLELLSSDLPEDLKARLFDWYQQPQYLENLDQLNFGQEWKQTLKKLKQEIAKDQVEQINLKIERLESKRQKTEAQKQQLEDLLTEIVKLQQKQKMS